MSDTNDCPCISGDDGDAPLATVHRRTERRARRAHACIECGEAITPGERYVSITGRWDDSWHRLAICLGCDDIRSTLFCGTWTYGDMWEDLAAGDMINSRNPPSACMLEQMSAAGAAKAKAEWGRQVAAEGGRA